MMAEFVYKREIQFNLSPKHSKKGDFQVEVDDVIRRMHMFLNYVGGIIILNPAGEYEAVCSDLWIRYLMDKCSKTIPYSILHTCLSSKVNDKTHTVVIIVRKSPILVTYEYGMCIRGPGAQVTQVTDLNTCARIINSSKSPNKQVRPQFSHKRKADLVESVDREFKYWELPVNFSKKIHNDETKMCISAFCNNPNGGEFIMGIRENTGGKTNPKERYQILGYDINGELYQKVNEHFRKLFGSLITPDEMGVGEGSWELLEPEKLEPEKLDNGKSLLILSVRYVTNGVFYKMPKCFTMAADGTERELSFKEWYDLIKLRESDRKVNLPSEFTIQKIGRCLRIKNITSHFQKIKTYMHELLFDQDEFLGNVWFIPGNNQIRRGLIDAGCSRRMANQFLLQTKETGSRSEDEKCIIIALNKNFRDEVIRQNADITHEDIISECFAYNNNGKAYLIFAVKQKNADTRKYARRAGRTTRVLLVQNCETEFSRELASRFTLTPNLSVFTLKDGVSADIEPNEHHDDLVKAAYALTLKPIGVSDISYFVGNFIEKYGEYVGSTFERLRKDVVETRNVAKIMKIQKENIKSVDISKQESLYSVYAKD